MDKIPKVIHYCWFGGNPLPEFAEKCIESWKKNCPNYEIKLWDESNFNVNSNKYVKEAYEAKKWAFVTDYVRLWAVYEYGGIYLDTDVELLKPLDDLLVYSGFMGFENKENIATGLGFGATKRNLIIGKILLDYDKISFVKTDGTYDLTPCPQRNTKILIKIGLITNNKKQIINDVVFLPTEFLSPKNYETGKLNITNNTYSIHHYDASWHPEEKRKLYKKGILYKKLFGKRIGSLIIVFNYRVCKYGWINTIKKVISLVIKKI